MSKLLYFTGTRFYFFIIYLISPFNQRAKAWRTGRRNLFLKLEKEIPVKKSEEKRFWFHCASLGEFEQARPLIELIKKKPGYTVIISFFSPSGYNTKKNYEYADYITYLPKDSKKNARKFLSLIKPDIAVFVKYEFWASYIFACKKQNIKLYGIAVILRKDQIFFKKYGGYFREILSAFDWLYLQNQESFELLSKIGINTCSVTGDSRYDRVKQIAEETDVNKLIETFKDTNPVFIAGSVWHEDMKVLSGFIKTLLKSDYKIIIAPHHINEKNISVITGYVDPISFVRYSNFDSEYVNQKVLILDTMGHLASAYRYGEIAYVGGAFKTGLHNTLEPVAHGLPVIFGPKYDKFHEAKELIKNGIGFSIKNERELSEIYQQKINTIIPDKDARKEFVIQKSGASLKIFESISK